MMYLVKNGKKVPVAIKSGVVEPVLKEDPVKIYKLGVECGIEKCISKLQEYKNEMFVDTYVVEECIKVLKELNK